MPRSLQTRLALWFSVVMAIVLTVFSVVVWTVAIFEPEQREAEGKVLTIEEQREEQEELAHAARRVLLAMLATLPFAVAAATAASVVVARRGLRPLADLVAFADALHLDRLRERFRPSNDSPREVEHLAASLNEMLERLDRSASGLRRFTADAAHELRTPLSRLRARLEGSLRAEAVSTPTPAPAVPTTEQTAVSAAVADAIDEIDQLTRLVEGLLTLSRADAGGLALGDSVVDASAVVLDVVDAWRGPADEKQQTLTVTAPAGLVVAGDRAWIVRALTNVIENAVKFTPAGGHIDVVARVEGQTVAVIVSDDGPGISPELSDRVFERFFRADPVRGSVAGHGLGLPLARDIARAMHGDLRLLPASASQTGASFVLQLQRA